MTEYQFTITTAIGRCRELQAQHPDDPVFQSILRQLEYLLAIDCDVTKDRSGLRDIILDYQAAKEIEPMDEEFANVLFQISSRTPTS